MRRPALADVAALLLLLLAALVISRQVYDQPRAATFQMNAPPGLLPAAGLNDLENFPNRGGMYRWTNGSGVLKLPNPGGAALLLVTMAAGPERSVPVGFQHGGSRLLFSVGPDARSYRLLLPPGAGDRLTLHIDSPVLDEGGRELGVLISNIRLWGGGGVPTLVLLGLLVAVAGVYPLLRQAGLAAGLAGATVLGLLGLALAWQGHEGWRYGVLATPLLLVGGASLAAVLLERRWPASHPGENDIPAPLLRTDVGWIALLLAVALCVRLPFLAARDPVGDIELAARQMNLLGIEGLAGAYRFGNDYMPLRIYLLRGLGLLAPLLGARLAEPLPEATLLLLKLPGLLADLATLALIYRAARRWRPARTAAGIGLLYTLSPPVWMNVAWWGQVDALLMLPLLGAVLLIERARGRWSWLCWAAALLIKPQAIIIAPLLYTVTLRRYGCRGLAQGAGLALALLLAACGPLALAQGGAGGIVQAYVGAVERFPLLTNRAYNLWYLVTLGENSFDVGQGLGPLSFRLLGLGLTAAVALLVMALLLRRSDTLARLEGAALLALAFFVLPTQIHERYLFLSLAFLALSVAGDGRMLAPYLALSTTATLNILGTLGGFAPTAYRAIVASPLPLAAAVVNLLVLVALLAHLVVGLTRMGKGL